MYNPDRQTSIPKQAEIIDNEPQQINTFSSFEDREIIERKLKEIITKSDQILTNYEKDLADEHDLNEHTGTRYPGERHLLCGLASEIVAYQINNDSQLQEMGVHAKPIQNINLHRQVRLEFQAKPTEDEINQAFQHSITLVYKPDGKVSLIDLTMCQYFDSESGLISEGVQSIPVNFSRMSIANKLMQTGEIDLSISGELFKYMAITTHNRDSSYLQALNKACKSVDLSLVPEQSEESKVGEKSVKRVLGITT